jgi:polyhydroxyalkanoate synthesis repressor PhaR
MKPKTPKPLIIKKYENRRLYNTVTSQYINQDQVAQLVREGHDVRVIDAATGEDITRLILAQIVLEDAKTPDSVFPLDVLRQMIVASGRATQDGALRYMRAMMDMYQNVYRAMPSPVNPFDFLSGRPPNSGNQGTPKGPLEDVPNDRNAGRKNDSSVANETLEVSELRRRVEELETILVGGGKAAKKSAAKRSRRKS